MLQAVAGNAAVVIDLPFQHGAHALKVDRVGKFKNFFYRKHGTVGERRICAGRIKRKAQYVFSVFGRMYDIRMLMDNFNRSALASGTHFDNKMERGCRIQQRNLAGNLLQKFLCALDIVFGYIGKNFKPLVRIAADNTDCRCSRNSFHISGIGNDNAFYVFNNVPAAFNTHSVRNFPEQPAGVCARIGDGNRFGTAEGGYQFFFKNCNKTATVGIGQFHTLNLFRRSVRFVKKTA